MARYFGQKLSGIVEGERRHREHGGRRRHHRLHHRRAGAAGRLHARLRHLVDRGERRAADQVAVRSDQGLPADLVAAGGAERAGGADVAAGQIGGGAGGARQAEARRAQLRVARAGLDAASFDGAVPLGGGHHGAAGAVQAHDAGLYRPDRRARAALARLDAERLAVHPVRQDARARGGRAGALGGAARCSDADRVRRRRRRRRSGRGCSRRPASRRRSRPSSTARCTTSSRSPRPKPGISSSAPNSAPARRSSSAPRCARKWRSGPAIAKQIGIQSD